MAMVKKISSFLANPIVQRVMYFLALILWVYLWYDRIDEYNHKSKLGIQFIWITLIPTILLTLQLIFNNRLLWFLILLLSLSISIALVVASLLLIRNGHFTPDTTIVWDFTTIFNLCIVYGLLFLPNFLIYKIQPLKRKKENSTLFTEENIL